jgi:multidrug efflux pump subunit AcrB
MLREDNKQIPVVIRMAPEEAAQLGDLDNLYVYPARAAHPVPLSHLAEFAPELATTRIVRRDRFRTLSVVGRPKPGVLASEFLAAVTPQLEEFRRKLPPGYRLVVGGEKAKEVQGFGELAMVIAVSIAAIFVALVLQFNHVVKPLLVFAAVPFGVVGALAALFATGTPFGFMAFLGITSLVGVIVSHVIVFFDFIEEMHEAGEPLEKALVAAGILRLRPVMVTVGATVLALFPLALHGGPLWQPLCYSQIGGLTIATFVTLLLIPVLYSIVVLDLKLVAWDRPGGGPHRGETAAG